MNCRTCRIWLCSILIHLMLSDSVCSGCNGGGSMAETLMVGVTLSSLLTMDREFK